MSSASSVKSVRLSASDYDINDIMSKQQTGNLASTDATYVAVMQRFADFIGVAVADLVKECFTDSNVALFLHDAGIQRNCHMSTEKTYCAAFRMKFLHFELPSFRQFPHEYPQITRVLLVS